VRERPFCCFQASLVTIRLHSYLYLRGRGVKSITGRTYHFSRARCDCSSFPLGHSMIPSTSPSILHQSWSWQSATPHHFVSCNVPMACLYNPYKRNLVADGGFCDPVRILLTVLSAWLKTRSICLVISTTYLSSHTQPVRHTN
jgi:hypothetical protein